MYKVDPENLCSYYYAVGISVLWSVFFKFEVTISKKQKIYKMDGIYDSSHFQPLDKITTEVDLMQERLDCENIGT